MNRKILFLFFIPLLSLLFLNGKTSINTEALQKAFDKAVKNKQIYEAVLYIENSDGSFSECFGYNSRDIDTPMLTASVGKLFTTACILILKDECRLSLEDKLTMYFSEEELKGLHVFKGREYSFDLTVSDLLFQTSGLPNTSRTFADEDAYFTFEERLSAIKLITPHFAPNTKSAYYANINFILLGEIVSKITEMPFTDACEKMIFSPLEMTNTYLPKNESDNIPHFYNGNQKLYRPKNIITSGAAGGFVSTPKDLMTFSKAFWGGNLFNSSVFNELKAYKKLEPYFGPAYYGGGHMKIYFDGIYAIISGKTELIGHSGVTGSFAFYNPQKDMYFVGDFSQLSKPSAPYLMLMRLSKLIN